MDGRQPDGAAIKERERATWSAASSGWKAHDHELVEFSRPVSEELLRRAAIAPGMRVLDLASGTGEPSLSIAERVGSRGSVLGIDLAEPMLRVAREKAAARRLSNVDYRTGDAESLEVPESSFDAATMRWGLMFLPNPVEALRRVRLALRTGGRFAVSTWGAPEPNPFIRIPLDVLRRHTEVPSPPPGSPGIFAFADPDRLSGAFREAGFTEVGVSELPMHLTAFRSGEDYWTFQREVVGPIARLYEPLPPETKARVDREIVEAAERFRTGPALDLPGTTWIGWGSR